MTKAITLQKYKDYQPTAFDAKGLNAEQFDISDWYVAPCGINRDSRDLDLSNWAEQTTLLGGESDTVEIHRFGHWACGWFEICIVTGASVETAQGIADRLENYPVLNEEDFSQRETDSANQYWEQCSVKERVELCQRAGVSVFAARRDYVPTDDSGYLDELLRRD